MDTPLFAAQINALNAFKILTVVPAARIIKIARDPISAKVAIALVSRKKQKLFNQPLAFQTQFDLASSLQTWCLQKKPFPNFLARYGNGSHLGRKHLYCFGLTLTTGDIVMS
ncbi:MAG: hypothetical protein WCK42_08915, partial [Myxococcaceae bacterium]